MTPEKKEKLSEKFKENLAKWKVKNEAYLEKYGKDDRKKSKRK